MMQSSDNLSQLPVLSTADKVSMMRSQSGSKVGSVGGSSASLRSVTQANPQVLFSMLV